MKKLQAIAAMFMVILIVMLPAAFAASMTVSIKGVDGEEGLAKGYDTLTVDVTANVPVSDTNAYARIYWRYPDSYNAIPCTKEAEGQWGCALTQSLSGISSDVYDVVLYNPAFLWDDDNAYKTKEYALTIDGIAPVVKSVEVNKLITTGPVNITYLAEDYAEAAGDTTKCAGLKEIRFYDNEVLVYTEPFSKSQTRFCKNPASQQKFGYTATTQGIHSICAEAEDWFGQKSRKKCISTPFRVSNVPPNLAESPLKIDGKSQIFVKTGFAPFGALIDITLSSNETINKNRVFADFSGMTTQTPRKNPTDIRPSSGNNQTFRFSVYVNKAIATDCGINVEATDTTGNTLIQPITFCGISVDNTGPAYSGGAGDLYTTTTKGVRLVEPEDGKPFVGSNVNLHIVFDEAGAGMSQKNAYVNFGALWPGHSREPATNCTSVSPSKWDCYWRITSSASAEGNYDITIHPDTADDIGNKISSTTSLPISADTTSPIMNENSIKIENLAKPGFPFAQNDFVKFTFNITNANLISADLSKMAGSGESQVPILCNDAGFCTHDEKITMSGPRNATLTFEIIAGGGNTETVTRNIQIYGTLNATTPDYWENSVDCNPIVDRETTMLIGGGAKVFCKINLDTDASATIASLTFDGITHCSGYAGQTSAIRIFNDEEGSETPFLEVNLLRKDFAMNELNIICPLKVYSKIGNSITENPEFENVTLPIKFYNMPLGEMNKVYDDKIKSAVKKAEKIEKLVGSLTKLVDSAEKICQIKGTLSRILGGLDAVLFTLSVIAPIPIYGKAPEQFRKGLCSGPKGYLENMMTSKPGSFWNYLDQMCSFVNCAAAEPESGKLGIGSFGGGVPWCKTITNFVESGGMNLGKILSEGSTATGENLTLGQTSVKDSLILSAACVCVPGILYNLNKYNQINCRYATCIANEVKTQGVPLAVCTEDKRRDSCQFVTGEIFNIIPFAGLLDRFFSILREAYANPFALAALVSGCWCGGCTLPLGMGTVGTDFCTEEQAGFKYSACTVLKTIAKIGDALQSTSSMKGKDFWKIGGGKDYCDAMKKELKEYT
jgi:hypothetical protein